MKEAVEGTPLTNICGPYSTNFPHKIIKKKKKKTEGSFEIYYS